MKWCSWLRDDYNGFYCLNFVSSLIDKNIFLEVHVCFISPAMSIVGNPQVIMFRYSPLITRWSIQRVCSITDIYPVVFIATCTPRQHSIFPLPDWKITKITIRLINIILIIGNPMGNKDLFLSSNY